MTSFVSPSSPSSPIEPRYARLAETAALAGGALSAWRKIRMALIGAGTITSRLAPELVRSGASVSIYDPGAVAAENLGTQALNAVGTNKAHAVRDACEAVRPGAALSHPYDVRHAGVGELAGVDGIVDCTDDPGLEWPLTEISNGLALPMFRLALDGSGEREAGRIQVSHGGGGAACRLCSKTPEQVFRVRTRTPCPGAGPEDREPTRAGAAIGLAVVGVAILLAQRYFAGNRRDEVLNAHVLVDLDGFQLAAMRERRSETCVSGHLVWDLDPLDRDAQGTTFGELFDLARQELGCDPQTLEPYGHPICAAARCECGAAVAASGTRWARPPDCPACGAVTRWEAHTEKDRWTIVEARQAGLVDHTVAELGLPTRGAMLVARAPGKPPLRMVLE